MVENNGVCIYGLYLGVAELDLDAIADHQLQCLNFGKFTAIVQIGLDLSQLGSQAEQDWIEFAIAYGTVQCQIFAKVRAMLPWSLRSAFFADLARLQQFLETDQSLFLARLQALEGWGEFSLVAIFEPELIKPDLIKTEETKGRAYFASRKHEFELKQKISLEAQAIVELVQTDPSKVVWGKVREKEQMRSSVLLKVVEEEQIREQLNNWQESHPGWQIELGESLPPYSFVNAVS
jgi:Gas vesicle synthesis protein GvpL/GvpF